MATQSLSLTKPAIKFLFVYYVIGLLITTYFCYYILIDYHTSDFLQKAIFGSFSISFVGAFMYYIRKLYKHCIRDDIQISKGIDLREFGSLIYFLIRPIFAGIFSVLIVLAISEGLIKISTKEAEFGDGFVHISMLISFFVGFTSGQFIRKMERMGIKFWINIFRDEKEDG